MERGEYFTNPHEHVANLNEYVANQSERQRSCQCLRLKRYNGNVHRAAVGIIASKNRGAGGSVCNVLLSWHIYHVFNVGTRVYALRACR